MHSIRRKQALAVVLAVGVMAAALSACGPEDGGTAADRAGAVAATVPATPPGPATAAATATATATAATTATGNPPSAPAPSATAASPTAAPSTAPGTPTASASRTPSHPAATAKAPSKAPTATGGAPAPAVNAPITPTATRPAPVAPAPAVPDTAAQGYPAGSAEALSLRLINEERARNGVPALVVKADLTDFAVKWAQHMRETGFAHSENASGAGPSLTGSRTLTGECIVMWSDAALTGQQAAEQFQKMWTESPGHHAAQINPRYQEIGVGFYHDSTGWWGVHEFAG
ncbi:CAP domain-containing protein [Kitasatospora sp. NPDC097643]|uniref:CAP domain-containing protein n=1 Tax=Kitasatospora sp. NPDC097643 TaxID=3157230 RepID=UPI00333094D1